MMGEEYNRMLLLLLLLFVMWRRRLEGENTEQPLPNLRVVVEY